MVKRQARLRTEPGFKPAHSGPEAGLLATGLSYPLLEGSSCDWCIRLAPYSTKLSAERSPGLLNPSVQYGARRMILSYVLLTESMPGLSSSAGTNSFPLSPTPGLWPSEPSPLLLRVVFLAPRSSNPDS